jgi:hypothetical protein
MQSAQRNTRLRFELGGFEANGIEIRLSRGRLLYSKTMGPFPIEPPLIIQPSEDQWRQFWQEVDHIGVWSWAPEYTNPNVLDGTQWSLSLSHAGRKLKSDGSNAYPGTDSIDCPGGGPFADFLRAIALLAGQPDLAFKGEL